MPIQLKSVKGITDVVEKSLREAGIESGELLQAATATRTQREELAQKVKRPVGEVYLWAKQVELMRIKGMSEDNAYLLALSGVRGLPDLVEADPQTLLRFMKIAQANSPAISLPPTLEEIKAWQESASALVPQLERDEADPVNNFLFSGLGSAEKQAGTLQEAGYFTDFAQVLTEVGRGVAQAQHQMDVSSMEIQNMILEDPELAGAGFNATWYSIPEVNFQLKMEYAVTHETTTSGSSSILHRLLISPSNAKYNNLFRTSQSGESSLSLRIVPLPPPPQLTERRVMPDLVGQTWEDAREELEGRGIGISNVQTVQGETANGRSSEVTWQSASAGKLLLVQEQVSLRVTVKETLPT